jgi:hyaluronoglucosaminidase
MNQFEVRGVIEGFYGVFYTPPQRDDLIRFLGDQGFNFYLYGPKNDRQHRARWREPYPEKVMRQFANTVSIARKSGVTFAYSLSPGVSMSYANEADYEAILLKFRAFYDIGVRDFCLLCDDMAAEFKFPADAERFRSYGEAHVYLCNTVYDWLQNLDPDCTMSMCPTDYWGGAPFSGYLNELGLGLHPDIDIFYTGIEICSTEISANDANLFAEFARRKPIIWHNYPANDLTMKPEMHIGPVLGLAPDLSDAVRGLVVNPMNQPEASKIPIYTVACYMKDPVRYNPQTSWLDALNLLAGEYAGALRLFAETSIYHGPGLPEAVALKGFVLAVLESLDRGEGYLNNPFVDMLLKYLNDLDEACYTLKFRMENLALRDDLLPWIELVELWMWIGRRSLLIPQALLRGEDCAFHMQMIVEELAAAKAHYKRIGGGVLLPLAERTLAMMGEAALVGS